MDTDRMRKTKIVFTLLWALPSVLFLVMGVTFVLQKDLTLKYGGENMAPSLCVIFVLFSVLTAVAALGFYKMHKSTLFISYVFMVFFGFMLVDQFFITKINFYKYTIIPFYFFILSIFTITIYKFWFAKAKA
jgi:hypothetical protein